MSLAAFSIRRRITVLMVTLGTAVIGFFSLNRLELKLLPDISYPTLTVRTEMEGTPPEEVENLISRPIEEALGIVSDLQQITSVSRAGLSDVIIEFQWNTEMDKALMDVREKLDTVILPSEAERPRILRYNPETEPVMKLALTGGNLVELHHYAENEMKSKLETLPGVAAVRVLGGEKEEVRIEVDTHRLSSLGLNLSDISRRLMMENVNLPGGMLEEGDSRFLVRTLNEFQTDSDIGSVVVATAEGTDIRLKDIAKIERAPIERKTMTRLNGRPSVILDVYKEGDANIIAVADSVRQQNDVMHRAGSSAKETLPDGMELTVTSDQSTFIRAAIGEVRSAAVSGCILAVAVIYLFLRSIPNTLIIGLSIPISIVATFTLMYFRSISLNLMSLGGLALGIGMLVDNSIVVLENIFRIRESGENHINSARSGTEMVTTAVTASTLTTIAVFFPIIFIGGVAGQLFNDLAWTIAFSLLASLAVALTFIPMVASIGLQTAPDPENVIAIKRLWREGWQIHRQGSIAVRFVRTVAHCIRQATRDSSRIISDAWIKTFRRPGPVRKPVAKLFAAIISPLRLAFVLLSIALIFTGSFLVNGSWLIMTIPLATIRIIWSLIRKITDPMASLFNQLFSVTNTTYKRWLVKFLCHPVRGPVIVIIGLLVLSALLIPRLGMDLIPVMAQGEFFIDIRLPVGSSLEQTAELVQRIETRLEEIPGIETVSSIIGSDMTTTATLGAEQEHMATLQIRLAPDYRDAAGEAKTIAILRASLSDISGIQKLEFRRPALMTLRTPLAIEVRGNDLDELMLASQQLADNLRTDSLFKDVTNSMETGYPEIQIVFDRIKLARLGLTPRDAADVLRDAIEGDISTQFGLIGEEVDIRVRAGRDASLTPDDIRRLVIKPDETAPVYLSAVADITRSVGPSEIRRINQRRVAVVRTEAPFLDLRRSADRIQRVVDAQPKLQGVYYAVTGQTVEMRESAVNLSIALCMAVFLVYLVMASQFESLIQPMIILISIPLGFVGVFLGLFLLQIPVSIVVFIGLIILAGIAVNNAIVLVDMANQLARTGLTAREAMIEAAGQRLRPITMTVMTTVLGLLPMALVSGPGEEIRKPLAITVILGLLVSTSLTLLLIPAAYSLIRPAKPVRKIETVRIDGH